MSGDFFHDFRLGLLNVVRRPSLAIVMAVVAMAIGIGAAVAVFSVVFAVLIRPLPYPDSERLVMVWNHYTNIGLPHLEISEPELYDYRKQGTSLKALSAIYVTQGNLTGIDEPERLDIALVSPAFFPVLGVSPAHGRAFVEGEDLPDSPRLAVLSDSFWHRRWGADPKAVGRDMLINGNTYSIIGVMPPGFRYPEKVDVWAPLRMDPGQPGARGNHYLTALGRLKPGVSMRQAQAEMVTIGRRLQQDNPNVYTEASGWGVSMIPLQQELTGSFRTTLLVLLGAVALVLLIACANVANLQIERALERGREIALRTALGAPRSALIRRFVAESLAVTILGASVGLGIAWLAVRTLPQIDPSALPRASEVELNAPVLLFALVLAILSGLLIGLVPAVQTRNVNLTSALKEGGEKTSGGRSRQRARRVLIVVETAMALMLSVGAGLLTRTFGQLQQVDLGFAPSNSLTLQLALPVKKYGDDSQVSSFFHQLVDQLEGLPEVSQAGLIDYLPLSGLEQSGSYSIESHPAQAGTQLPEADLRIVSPHYFGAMGIPLLKGRPFGPQDAAGAPESVVVDDTLAQLAWPKENPVGQRLKLGAGPNIPWRTVVGVVKHVRNSSLQGPSREQIYLPFAQSPARAAFVVVRSNRDATTLIGPIRGLIKRVDGDLPIFDALPMSQRVKSSMASRRLSMTLLLALAVLALFLAAVGMYAVIAHSVAQRDREIGVRIAIGAQRQEIFGMIVGEALKLALIGVVVGIAGSLWAASFLRSLLYGIGTNDLLTYLTTSLLLASTAAAASFFPARRATQVSPSAVLKRE